MEYPLYKVKQNGVTVQELLDAIPEKADKATTLAGYGITNSYTKDEENELLYEKADKATTIAGYGITDAYTKEEENALLNVKADEATTLAGYGINDAYTKSEVNALIIPHDEEVVVVSELPETGEPNLIYRVPGVGSYTDNAWNGSEWVTLATYSNAYDAGGALS